MNFYENMNLFRKAKNESEHKNKNLKEEGISESILEIKNAIEETRRYTQDDDSHIIMQLRSAQDLKGNKDVAFRGGKKAKVDIKDINTILKAHDSIPKPENKRRFRIMISKSHEDLKNIAKELREEVELDESISAGGYTATSEVSQFGGHRPKVVHKNTGKVLYLGGYAYKKPEDAKKHAENYLKAYESGGEGMADRASKIFVRANQSKLQPQNK